MNRHRRRSLAVLVATVCIALGGSLWWQQQPRAHYLTHETAEFVALFSAPPAADSPQTRRELDELLQMQARRTPAAVAAAQADRKTEIRRFYAALELDPDARLALPRLHELAQRVEDDIRPYVRAAKQHFRRLRPLEIEPRLEPCIGDVKADLSYPSGHATYGFVMSWMLADLIPERRAQLQARGEEFARQRMVCGVHFASDIEAGRTGARWLMERLHASPAYQADVIAAAAELRAAMRTVPRPAPRSARLAREEALHALEETLAARRVLVRILFQ